MFFTLDSPNQLRVEIEDWHGIIPRPLHSEELKYRRVSQSAWQEGSSWGGELYAQTSPDTSTPCR
jgi:hypothetical protein